ncbi:WXG100 family type VII secretion target [Segniliparus rugosus]|uniref:ESAT-6-like protein n=1 Tax=Segniliparus rugosus (strain ATCC BAA-974 / DSM 45345 / CCUG 50838 / CIP 108380 / JCM 13579 / CDC 945) TaxID=679197 RepID=E5XKN7_SEGRC|nr:WXG100 family type VII secretion target [Segniliparus rugosus]EFV15084.1 WXG100 family type VII secretion target [Segniliparus rugosus ATCC BAA-974]
MGDIAYDFGHIQELAQQIQTVSSQIEGLLGEIDTEVQKLASGWEGEAQATWHTLQTKWGHEADDLKGTLHDLSAKVGQAGEAMQHAEAAIGNKFQP